MRYDSDHFDPSKSKKLSFHLDHKGYNLDFTNKVQQDKNLHTKVSDWQDQRAWEMFDHIQDKIHFDWSQSNIMNIQAVNKQHIQISSFIGQLANLLHLEGKEPLSFSPQEDKNLRRSH